MNKQLSSDAFKKHAIKSPSLALVLKALANRERPRPVTDVRRLRDEIDQVTGHRLKKEDLIEALRLLEGAGAGVLNIPTNPVVPMRFEWAVDYIEMARTALDMPPRSEVKPRSYAAPAATMASFPLSSGELVHIPLSITPEDAVELAKFVKRIVTTRKKAK